MRKGILIFILVSSFTLIASSALAQQTNYRLLQSLPLPGSGCTGVAGENCTPTPKNYIEGIFVLAIAIAGILAVVMIIFGGIKYMSTDAFSGKDEAKHTIQNAIWGLLLAMGAWLILYTVNPNLVSFNLSIQPQPVTQTFTGRAGGGTLPGYTLTPAQVEENTNIINSLPSNVTVNAPPCTTGGTSGCTNLVGLPSSAISGVISLASSCGCSIVISGGSEGGHQTHGPNIANVDLRISTALNNYITQNGTPTTASCGIAGVPKYSLNGAIYTLEGTHWHVCY